MTRILKNNFASVLIAGFILALGIFIALTIYAQTDSAAAQNDEPTIQITFPVPELGNCTSKSACKKYCDDPANASACIAFAENHGLMNREEASRSKKFAETIQANGGPGGCRTPEECRSFCSSLTNLQICLDFAKQQGINDDEIDHAEKVNDFLKNGGKTPGNCTSKESCSRYCGDFSHAEECAAFAKSAGITQKRDAMGGENEPTPDQMSKLQELTATGQTPGGCKSKDECERYCGNPDHRQECIDFGVKIGFIKQEEAQRIKELGGKGPGGCASSDSCKAFCSDPANRETCFRFGEEHGFISENESKNIKEGLVRFRTGTDQMPQKIRSCVESIIGTSTIQSIEAGDLVPGPEIANQTRTCFERFGKALRSADPFMDAPEETRACLKEKLGDAVQDLISGKTMPTPEMGDAFRVCSEQMRLFGPNANEENRGRFGSSSQGIPPGIERFIQSAPPQIEECLKNNFGDNFKNEILSGNINPGIGDKIKNCMMQFRPQDERAPMMRQGEEEFQRMMNQQNRNFKLDDQGNPINQNPQMPQGGYGTPIRQPILNGDGFQPNALEFEKRLEYQQSQQNQLQQYQNMQYQNMEGTMAPPIMINPPPLLPEPQTLLKYSPFGFLLHALFGY